MLRYNPPASSRTEPSGPLGNVEHDPVPMPFAGGDGHEDQEFDGLEREEVFWRCRSLAYRLGDYMQSDTSSAEGWTLGSESDFSMSGPHQGRAGDAFEFELRTLTPQFRTLPYCDRSATIGSTRDARRAGT